MPKASPAEADFQDVLSFLISTGVVQENPPAALINTARKLHSAIFSLMLWRFFLRHPERGQLFLKECCSDAVQILPLALAGFKKPTALLMRSIIENVLRHIYFADHPVEFIKFKRTQGWYIAPSDLFTYAKEHFAFENTKGGYAALTKLRDLYSRLSAGVHGSTVQALNLHKALDDIAFDQATLHSITQLASTLAGNCNFLLMVFNRHRIAAVPPKLQTFVLMTMPKAARQTYHGLA